MYIYIYTLFGGCFCRKWLTVCVVSQGSEKDLSASSTADQKTNVHLCSQTPNSSEESPKHYSCLDSTDFTRVNQHTHTYTHTLVVALHSIWANGVLCVLPPGLVHPLAAILLPHNGLLVGGKNYQGARTRRETVRKTEIKRWREREKEMKKAVSNRASELSYSCYDLSSLKSFLSLLFHFLFPPSSLSPSGLWEVFIFLMSRWFSILFFFCRYLIRSGWKAIFVILSSRCSHLACVCVSAYVSACVDCGGAKWYKVFTPWFWLALVEEVDTGVRVVWHNGPGRHLVLPALSICRTVGGLHLTWLL